MKKTHTHRCFRTRACVATHARRKGGYIALGLVSTISLVMLVVSVSIARRIVDVALDVGSSESLRAAQTVALSCVSIAREKVKEGGFENAEANVAWQLRSFEQGSCQVTVLETVSGFTVRIVAQAGGNTSASASLSVDIEKASGRVQTLSFL
jgi:hypothetical protein